MNKLLFIGHSYHIKTKSSDFIEKMLSNTYHVDKIFEDSWEHGGLSIDYAAIDIEQYDAIVIWQIIELLPRSFIKKISKVNTTYFPMENYHWGWDKWRKYKNLKIISFSLYNYTKLANWGLDVSYFQYFPKPEIRTDKPFKKRKFKYFFWQRLNYFNWNNIKKYVPLNSIEQFILHNAPDPGHKFIEPNEEDKINYRIRVTSWFAKKEDLMKLIDGCDIYIAPRNLEGIGMSFLEAMARGKVIIAIDAPTMNEYIINNKNGYLLKIEDNREIDLLNIESIRKESIRSICEGYNKWEKDKGTILDIIARKKRSTTSIKITKVEIGYMLFEIKKISIKIIKNALPRIFIDLYHKYYAKS